jgi:prolyl-tRNA synthetase
MKDSYSLDTDWDGLDRQYRRHYQAYFNIFRRCGLDVIAVQADTGMMGGKLAHEFMFLTAIGEDTLMLCDACGFSANRQIAKFRKRLPESEDLRPVEKVATPDCKTIDELADFLGVRREQTAKAVFMIATLPPSAGENAPVAQKREQFVFAVVRGDMEVNETKLANVVGAQSLRPATEDEIRAVGAAPGYASPLGLKNTLVVADDAIPHSPNLVAGANESGYHLRHVNYGRDYQAAIVTDIAAANPGDACPNCGAALRAERGVEVGNIFKLGTRYSQALGCNFLDAEGKPQPIIMGSYGIGVGRLLACVAEAHHDDHGLIWPVTVAPYPVHLTALVGKGNPETAALAERVYAELCAAGLEPLYDDRTESPGVKFNDADLIGLPLRVTVSERALQAGGVELKRRDRTEREIVALDQLLPRVHQELDALTGGIHQTLKPEELSAV